MTEKPWIENCAKADKFKEEEPEKYQQLITTLAELEDCRERIKEMRLWERDVIDRIHELDPPYEAIYAGVGKATINKSKGKRWDHEAMWNVLVARARDARLIDKETGEVLESEGQAVRRVLEQCAYVSYWRLEPLKEYGIDPDEYYETTSVKNAVRIQN